MQSKKHSLIESNVNTFTGFVVSWILMYFIVPLLWDIEVTVTTSLGIVLLFTFVSIIRNYIIRRLFNYYHLKKL